jgi:plasmid maintenance system antidote protein VapI
VQEPFDKATENWMNFQKTFQPQETFKTTAQQDIPEMEDRTEKFKLRQNNLTKNEQAI